MQTDSSPDFRPLAFVCPRCSAALPGPVSDAMVCPACGSQYAVRDGIYRFLLPERWGELQPFVTQYRRIRQGDGYRARGPDYYRSLPWPNAGDPQAGTWRVRADSFDHLCHRVLPTLKRGTLSVLDLGAGNGWLSHRLAALGHNCVAVDWLDDSDDGLGAFVYYPVKFVCVQADFDRLPFAPTQFGLIIYNASLHYAPDVFATLRHAFPLLTPDGVLAIMDSPTFRLAATGRQMVAEQEARFRAQLGLTEIVRPGVGYLTFRVTADAGRRLGLRFRFIPSRGSIRWALRRLAAGIRRGREPARFGVWWARRDDE